LRNYIEKNTETDKTIDSKEEAETARPVKLTPVKENND